VKNCDIYFYLPDRLPDSSDAVVVGHESGRIIVEAFGKQWNLALVGQFEISPLLFIDALLARQKQKVEAAMTTKPHVSGVSIVRKAMYPAVSLSAWGEKSKKARK
jgi:hypothetical protein